MLMKVSFLILTAMICAGSSVVGARYESKFSSTQDTNLQFRVANGDCPYSKSKTYWYDTLYYYWTCEHVTGDPEWTLWMRAPYFTRVSYEAQYYSSNGNVASHSNDFYPKHKEKDPEPEKVYVYTSSREPSLRIKDVR